MNLREVQQRAAASRTLIDRLVEYVSPSAGLERLKHRAMISVATGTGAGGYDGGRRDRRGIKRWRPREASADADILPDLPDLRGRARDLRRNIPIATGALATKATNVIGTGLALQASIDHEFLGLTEQQGDAWERAAEREYALACNTLDFTSVQHFSELQYLAFTAADESGDVFVVRRFRTDPGDVYGTKVQLLEADRVSNPDRAADTDTIAGGVELAGGRAVAYHVTDKHPGGARVGALKWERVPARTAAGKQVVLHLFDRQRPEQTRGVPYLAPVIELVKQLGDYTEAEVRAAVLTSFITWFVTHEVPEDPEDPQPLVGERDSTLEANEIKLGAGALVDLGMGEKVEAPSPSRPNPQFDPFFLAMTRMIGVALELPHELLIKHFTASYSASRAALEMAWQSFRRWRAWFARRFCQTIYEWVIEEAVALGRLPAPGYFADPLIAQAYCRAEWIGPARASLDPKKEAEADEIDIRTGVKTREQVCLERTGGQVEKKIAQLGKERTLQEQHGIAAPPPPDPSSSAVRDGPGDQDGGTDDDTEDETRRRA